MPAVKQQERVLLIVHLPPAQSVTLLLLLTTSLGPDVAHTEPVNVSHHASDDALQYGCHHSVNPTSAHRLHPALLALSQLFLKSAMQYVLDPFTDLQAAAAAAGTATWNCSSWTCMEG
jgi:hypothetical protein